MKVIFSFYNKTGLGDNIRGLITLKQVQKQIPFELCIDFNGHPIEPYLQYKSICFDCDHTLFFPAHDNNSHNDYILNQLRDNTHTSIRITTNLYPEPGIDEEIKTFMKDFLLVKPEFDLSNRELPDVYDLFHYRLGDKYMCQDTDGRAQNILLDDVLKHFLIHNTNMNSVIISDSLEFKKLCKHHTNVIIYLNDPLHTRLDTNHKINSPDMIETIRDFYLIKHAKNVYSFSAFPWISNFVLWTSKIYDVPLERI